MSTPQSDWLTELSYAALSDIGMRRANNQDAYLVMLAPDMERWLERGHLFVVADGMGAHAAGELASRLAADAVGHAYLKQQESPPESLLRALRQANDVVHQRGQMNADFHNMGTTCSSLLLLPQGAIVAHVGDSRVYRLRSNTLEQLTFDHSLQWEMRALARTRDEENVVGIPKNVITRSIGPKPQVQIDLEGPYPLQSSDTFLLSSDGLTGVITDEELAGILHYLPPPEAAALLIDLANLRGGPDNITVVVVSLSDAEMVREAAKAPPLYVGSTPTPPPYSVHPANWIALGVGALLSLVFWTLQQLLLGWAAMLIALFAGGIALTQAVRPTLPRREIGSQRWGKGPYQKVQVPTSEHLMDRIREACQARQPVVDGSVPLPGPATPMNATATTAALREWAQVAHRLLYPPDDAS
ncbi:MAG: protein phosphatase 2C domain-containing protein [Planctomycetota bacterium]|nr:protein phosphatase 2C domain-containing protein [Planctomycetota bacterium]MDA1178549.1 protein phosphatase 2C domain-containing protein [Planctomycetota bacterium]